MFEITKNMKFGCTHILLISGGPGDFSFANIYSSNMVLQKAPARAKIWGYAEEVCAIYLSELIGIFNILWDFIMSNISGNFLFILLSVNIRKVATQIREYRVTMAEELRNLPIQGDYVTPPP